MRVKGPPKLKSDAEKSALSKIEKEQMNRIAGETTNLNARHTALAEKV